MKLKNLALSASAVVLAAGSVFALRSCNQKVLSTGNNAIDATYYGTYEGRTRELVNEQGAKIDSLSMKLEELSKQNQMLVNKVDSLAKSK